MQDGRGNLFSEIPPRTPDEFLEALLVTEGVRVERIVSQGHRSPDGFWYEQPQSELVVLLRGAAHLRFEDDTLVLSPGDWVNIPARQRHRVEWTTTDEPTIWLAVHYGELPERQPVGRRGDL